MRCALTPMAAAFVLSCSLLSRTAVAQFAGFEFDRQVVAGSLDEYRVVRAYARFNSPNDVLLNIFNASLTLSYGGAPVPALLQAADPDLGLVESYRPVGFNAAGERWSVDSFVTIGAEQTVASNGTVLDPSFDDNGAASGLGFAAGSGWYNIPPNNGHGVAGADGRVLVGQFTVPTSAFVAGMRLAFTADVGYSSLDTLEYGSHDASVLLPESSAPEYVVDDLDGDAIGDLLYVRPKLGTVSCWLLDGSSVKSASSITGPSRIGYPMQGIGDIDGDGDTDIVWRRAGTGAFSAWRIDALQKIEDVPLAINAGLAWKTLALTDVSGDSKADLLLYHPRSHQVSVWLLKGTGVVGQATLGAMPDAKPLGVGDFDGDGRRDILWRRSNGTLWGWLLDGTTIRVGSAISNPAGPVGSGWGLLGIADFDGDGADDLLWRQAASGRVTLWRMNGLQCLNIGVVGGRMYPAWSVAAVTDLNGDGRADILWRRASDGMTRAWMMRFDGTCEVQSAPRLSGSVSIGKPKMFRF